jgi:hypothetical protein
VCVLLPDVLKSHHSLCGFDVCTSEDLCGLSVPDRGRLAFSGWSLIVSTMIVSKAISDNMHSNESWHIIGQGVFADWGINQMEREMCSYLK